MKLQGRITAIALLVSFAISGVAFDLHRHAEGPPQSCHAGLSKNTKQMEEGSRICTICSLARHRVSSPPVELFGAPLLVRCSQPPVLHFQSLIFPYATSISLRGPPAFLS